jgi:hypothetical protein
MATKDYSRLLLKGMAAGSLLLGVSHLCTAAEAKSSASVGEVIVTV